MGIQGLQIKRFSSLVLIDFSIFKHNEYFENICGGGDMTWQLRAMPAIAACWKFDSQHPHEATNTGL